MWLFVVDPEFARRIGCRGPRPEAMWLFVVDPEFARRTGCPGPET
jgi:hypothetical protein